MFGINVWTLVFIQPVAHALFTGDTQFASKSPNMRVAYWGQSGPNLRPGSPICNPSVAACRTRRNIPICVLNDANWVLAYLFPNLHANWVLTGVHIGVAKSRFALLFMTGEITTPICSHGPQCAKPNLHPQFARQIGVWDGQPGYEFSGCHLQRECHCDL